MLKRMKITHKLNFILNWYLKYIPSKHGLMCHRFDKTGVFYFSDQNFEEAAEYIGTIIVKPKQREHIIKVQKDSFEPGTHHITLQHITLHHIRSWLITSLYVMSACAAGKIWLSSRCYMLSCHKLHGKT